MLSPIQIDHYHTFGFLVLRTWLTAGEVRILREESERTLVEEYRHLPFDGTRRHFSCMLGAGSPLSASLFEDPRFFDAAEDLHGPVMGQWCDANRYVDAVTPWHPDLGQSFEQGGVKFLIYLDPVTPERGAIRFIPGSHHRPLHERVRAFMESAKPAPESVPAIACATQPGDVVAFNFPLWHASVGGFPDRRLNTLAYHPCPVDDQQRRRRADEMTAAIPANQGYGWKGEVYPDSWVASAAGNPRRRILVERLRAAGVLQAAQAARPRETATAMP
ncbi:MAG: phytanoyl-CoA dioxygenase family protein [Planctomycetes bacterium]|nr:phytanoyl-CoA dioxygenase family protein [Planctomycetota bacterium]